MSAPFSNLSTSGLSPETWLITGAAGFVGSHLVDRLLAESDAEIEAGKVGFRVVGVDNFDPFYDPNAKHFSIQSHLSHPHYRFIQADIRDPQALASIPESLTGIVHLAALAGVRPSLADPARYLAVNVLGTQTLLEMARQRNIRRFVFGSSSSVYGTNPHLPWSEKDTDLRPISPYAASKISGEHLGRVYSHHYGIQFTALRLFTVYGPRQRPDLAIHKFARCILAGDPLPMYGDGSTSRDYTYVMDTVAGIRAAMAYDGDPWSVFNLGNDQRVTLLEVVQGLETVLGHKAKLDWQPEQPGDVSHTWADISLAGQKLGYAPKTSFLAGLQQFAEWLQSQ
ncbi:MAG: NAD-dependent epimerase/dehydratase family protein [Synechococcaceae cyanobacterium SM2_3_2]|nr:NAD-dependent epimerase/dehydratase family protein [Synechococcaceae cyanobacterium SM2_3_2]